MHQAVHNTFGLAKTEFSYCLTAGEKLGAEGSLDYLTLEIGSKIWSDIVLRCYYSDSDSNQHF